MLIVHSRDIENIDRYSNKLLEDIIDIDTDIIVIAGKESTRKELYKTVYKAIRANKTVKLVDCGLSNEIYNFIVMFMVSNGAYNIYKANKEVVDNDYINTLSSLDSGKIDLRNFIEGSVDKYDDVLGILTHMSECNNSDELTTLISNNLDTIAKSIDMVQLIKIELEYLSNDSLVAFKDNELNTLRDKLSSLENSYLDQLKTKEAELVNKENQIVSLTEQLSKLSSGAEATDVLRAEMEKQSEQAKQELEQARQELTQVREEIDTIRIEKDSEIESYKAKIEELEVNSSELESKLVEIEAEKEEISTKIENIDTEKNNLVIQLEEMKAKISEHAEVTTLLEEAKHKIAQLEAEIEAESQQHSDDKEEKLRGLAEERESLLEQLSEKESKLDELEGRISELSDAETKIKELQNEIEELRPKKADLSQVDSLNRTIDDMRSQYEELIIKERDIRTAKDSIETELASKEAEVKSLNGQVSKLKEQNEELIAKMNDRSPTIQVFRPIMLQTTLNRTKHILYFKEISYVTYVNSLIINIMKFLDGADIKKVKLVIYDNKNDFNIMYNGMQTVTGQDYASKREDILNKLNKVAVLDYSTHILEDILKQDNELVIVYDRLKSTKDLVMGSLVTKFYVVNSRNHLDNTIKITGSDIPPENIISRPRVVTNSIAPVGIKGYQTDSESAKLVKWAQMRSGSIPDTDIKNVKKYLPIITDILKRAGIELEIGR